MSQNFRLFHVSNLSVRNFRIVLLMYTGTVPWGGGARPTRVCEGPAAVEAMASSLRGRPLIAGRRGQGACPTVAPTQLDRA